MSERKQIGIVASLTKEGIFGVGNAYMQLFSKFGDVVILTPDSPVQDLDLLVLRGGADLSPVFQGQIGYKNGLSNPYLDHFYATKLRKYVNKKTPIFGICRGLQELNVFFGGTLQQNIDKHPTNDWEKARTKTIHKVKTFGKIPIESFDVNSFHHQAVGELGGELRVLLKSEDGHVEAFEHKTLPIEAVQWHPEEILDEWSLGAIERLLNS